MGSWLLISHRYDISTIQKQSSSTVMHANNNQFSLYIIIQVLYQQILYYIKYIFYYINQTKNMFKYACCLNIIIQVGILGYFNISKQDIKSYYSKQIKRHKNINNFITNIGNAIYIILIKNFCKKTNIKNNYKKQILNYNIKKFSLIIKNIINKFFSSKTLIKANNNVILQINFVSNTKKFRKNLKQLVKKTGYISLQYNQLSSNNLYLVEITTNNANILRLIGVLVVFIK